MYSRHLEKKKAELKLNTSQKEIVIGTMLGDGHLETQNSGRTYRLKIEHSLKQKEYVDWLHKHFADFVETPPRSRVRNVDFGQKGKGVYELYGFQTLSIGSWRFYAQQFYVKGKKVVPRQIKRWLTPLALAVWFMDDGSIKSKAHRTMLLNTQGFLFTDIQRLLLALRERYKMETSIRKQVEGNQLYVVSGSAGKFFSVIAPHIIPSMRYKLPKVWLT